MKIPLTGDESVVIAAVFGAAFRFLGTRKESVSVSISGFIAGLALAFYVVHPVFAFYAKYQAFEPGVAFLAAVCGLPIITRLKNVTPGIVGGAWENALTGIAGAILARLPKPESTPSDVRDKSE